MSVDFDPVFYAELSPIAWKFIQPLPGRTFPTGMNTVLHPLQFFAASCVNACIVLTPLIVVAGPDFLFAGYGLVTLSIWQYLALCFRSQCQQCQRSTGSISEFAQIAQ
jgi:hypothetical protein